MGSIWVNVLYLATFACYNILAKRFVLWLVFWPKGLYLAKLISNWPNGLYLAKLVVFGQNGLYSIWTYRLY